MKKWLVLTVLLSVPFALQAKKHVSTVANLGATIVYVYNPAEDGEIGHKLPITFNGVTTTGPYLDAKRFWPAAGDTVIASGPTLENKRSGVTDIAEFSRNVGLERGVTYTFTETVDLPGIGPKVFLVQKVLGKSVITGASNSWVGIWAPELGVQEQLYDDTAWHRVAIEQPAGTWLFEFCSYHSRTLPTQVASLDPYATFADSSINSSIAGRVVSSLWQVSCGMLGMGVGVAVASAEEGGRFKFERNEIGIPELGVGLGNTALNKKSTDELNAYVEALEGVLLNDIQNPSTLPVSVQLRTPQNRRPAWEALTHIKDFIYNRKKQDLSLDQKKQIEIASSQERERLRELQIADEESFELSRMREEVRDLANNRSLSEVQRKFKAADLQLKFQDAKQRYHGEIGAGKLTLDFSPEWNNLIEEIKTETDPKTVAKVQAMSDQERQNIGVGGGISSYLTPTNVAGAAVVVTLTLAAIAALTIAPTPFANMLYKISYLPKELVGTVQGNSVRTQGSGV